MDIENVQEDFSFGIVPYYRDGNRVYVLLLKHAGGHWGFAKGHANPKESEIDTAKRELFEESGLEVDQILEGHVLEEKYVFRHNGIQIKKTVKYFIASVKDPKRLKVDLVEIVEGRWTEVNEAPKLATFHEARKICRQVAQLLQGKDHD